MYGSLCRPYSGKNSKENIVAGSSLKDSLLLSLQNMYEKKLLEKEEQARSDITKIRQECSLEMEKTKLEYEEKISSVSRDASLSQENYNRLKEEHEELLAMLADLTAGNKRPGDIPHFHHSIIYQDDKYTSFFKQDGLVPSASPLHHQTYTRPFCENQGSVEARHAIPTQSPDMNAFFPTETKEALSHDPGKENYISIPIQEKTAAEVALFSKERHAFNFPFPFLFYPFSSKEEKQKSHPHVPSSRDSESHQDSAQSDVPSVQTSTDAQQPGTMSFDTMPSSPLIQGHGHSIDESTNSAPKTAQGYVPPPPPTSTHPYYLNMNPDDTSFVSTLGFQVHPEPTTVPE